MSQPSELFGRMYDSVRHSETLPPRERAAHTARQLAAVVRHAAATSPFYGPRLSAVRFSGDGIDPGSWPEIPLLTRLDLRDNLDTIRSTSIPEHHGKVSTGSTSGTSGIPVYILRTQMMTVMHRALQSRFYAWHRFRGYRTMVHIKGDQLGEYPDGERHPGPWLSPHVSDDPPGPWVRLRHPLELEKQIEFLSRQGPCYLNTQPSNAMGLALMLREMGAKAPELDIAAVITVGELVRPGHRDVVREALGCPIADIYSASEFGTVAHQCPNGRLHINAETHHVEILRADGSPAQEGEEGGLVVSSLHNWASPLIRYDTGDIGRWGAPCDCGVNLPVLELSVGRERHMFRFSDGTTVTGFISLENYLDFFPAIQWQVVQTGPESLLVRYYSTQPDEAHDLERVRTEIRGYFKRPLDVAFERMRSIDYGPRGKLLEALRR